MASGVEAVNSKYHSFGIKGLMARMLSFFPLPLKPLTMPDMGYRVRPLQNITKLECNALSSPINLRFPYAKASFSRFPSFSIVSAFWISSLIDIFAMFDGAIGQSSLQQFLFRSGSWQP